MAIQTYTAQLISTDGLTPVFSAPSASGNIFQNNEKEYIEVINGSASDRVVTVAAVKTCTFGELHNISEVVATSTTQKFGPFPARWFSNGSEMVTVNFNSVSDVTMGVFRLP